MRAEDIAIVAAAVVALTQLLKWAGVVTDRRGPLVVMILALVGVLLYEISTLPGDIPLRPLIWPTVAAWIICATSAAGVFGFTRSGPESITSTKNPPSGAGASPTS